ncbi:hypothetical protein M199_gp171 [Halogranum tailed virus 1]|uniref:Uncharacterized protein n=1 Tax=Halogranum tailed virus 1 TaxID=1273749 RepID=R4T9A7_9CAUD|nr:hypothetical protein M199_gp171 [Halogranum tailed virus 1]AGM11495.1 hypothetical protein HGTV1_198 [Halogranum tailed virus 1]
MVKINLDDYDKAAEFGPVTKFEQTVRTPGWPDDEAECRKVMYEAGHYFKVARISTLGWGVTEYNENGRPIRRSSSENLGYFDNEEDAHAQAREWVEEYVSEQ